MTLRCSPARMPLLVQRTLHCSPARMPLLVQRTLHCSPARMPLLVQRALHLSPARMPLRVRRTLHCSPARMSILVRRTLHCSLSRMRHSRHRTFFRKLSRNAISWSLITKLPSQSDRVLRCASKKTPPTKFRESITIVTNQQDEHRDTVPQKWQVVDNGGEVLEAVSPP